MAAWADEGREGDADAAVERRRCEAIDLLFVVDGSRSMFDHQRTLARDHEVLVAGLPDSIQQLRSLHVGVIASGPYSWNNAYCREAGGLVVETGGARSSRRACGPWPHHGALDNFVHGSDPEALGCAMRIGTEGPGADAAATAAVAAITAPLTSVGQCNEGFARAEALQVLVFVTDGDIATDPLSAYIALAEAKHDDDRNLVVVTLSAARTGECEHARAAVRLRELTDVFGYAVGGSVCAPSYDATFERALEAIALACGVP
ncbi:MAG: hypothetical protein K1X88_04580 [Nannocystaceae bacterium]|nr:hypothetical protein [Nannocystaceae bacterium]